MFFGSIALIVDFIGLAQFIGWVAPSCVHTDIILNSIISKLQRSIFYVTRAMNRVPVCMITLILGKKWRLGAVVYFLLWLFWEKMIVRRSLRTISHFFCTLQN